MKKALFALVVLCGFVVSAFAEKPTELVMYLVGNPAGGVYEKALAEFNKKAQAELNVTLKVNFIGWGDFSTKYPLILASGEPIDLIYTSTWLNFFQQAQKGAFLPLETIGPKNAPVSFRTEPKEGLLQATINGHLYALPPNYSNYATRGPIVRGDLMKKYGIADIKTFDDYGAYLMAVAKADRTMDPAGMMASETSIDTLYFYSKDWYPLAGDPVIASPFWIDINDKSGKVINFVNDPSTPALLQKLGQWSKAGAWPKSVLSNKDDKMFEHGKSASYPRHLDNWVQEYQKNPQWDARFFNMMPKPYPLPYMQDGMAIPASSKNPDKALQLLDKLRNDEGYYMLLTYGIAGQQYKLTKDNLLDPLDTANWAPEQYCSWGWRDNRYRRDLVGSPPQLAAVRADLKARAVNNIYVSFSQNIEPVKNEYAAVLNVMQQYWIPMKLGYVDSETGLKTLKAKLKAAGVDKVQAEFQKQVSAFLASRK